MEVVFVTHLSVIMTSTPLFEFRLHRSKRSIHVAVVDSVAQIMVHSAVYMPVSRVVLRHPVSVLNLSNSVQLQDAAH